MADYQPESTSPQGHKCSDFADTLLAGTADKWVNVVHYHDDHVCLVLEHEGKRYALSVTPVPEP